ncbi:MAG TPA: BlaI/MecI/CopY family transcriptional regulator [Fimbriimonas sp.]|nr:BlaI/MecI/CopY family transcriptional regulator [Fimbriimonas sp.]
MSKSYEKQPLTPAQLEILQILVEADAPLTAAETWTKLSEERQVSRSTVSTQLERMAKGGWISRSDSSRNATYSPERSSSEAKVNIAQRFLDRFFDASVSTMVLSLVNESVDKDELAKLRAIIDEAERKIEKDGGK